VVRNLIKEGIDVNLGDNVKNETPLIKLTSFQDSINLEIYKLLIENGADVNALNWENRNILMIHLIFKHTNLELVKLLIDQGIHLNHKDNDNLTVLDRLIPSDNYKLTETDKNVLNLLITSGATSKFLEKESSIS
jgi:ankyrin repeat protein